MSERPHVSKSYGSYGIKSSGGVSILPKSYDKTTLDVSNSFKCQPFNKVPIVQHCKKKSTLYFHVLVMIESVASLTVCALVNATKLDLLLGKSGHFSGTTGGLGTTMRVAVILAGGL